MTDAQIMTEIFRLRLTVDGLAIVLGGFMLYTLWRLRRP